MGSISSAGGQRHRRRDRLCAHTRRRACISTVIGWASWVVFGQRDSAQRPAARATARLSAAWWPSTRSWSWARLLQHGLAVVGEEDVRQFSPALAIQDNGAACAPLLIARAGQDHPALIQGLDAFVQAALAANIPPRPAEPPARAHGFDILDDDERSREIIARAIRLRPDAHSLTGAASKSRITSTDACLRDYESHNLRNL